MPIDEVSYYLKAFDTWLSENSSATVMLNKLVTGNIVAQKQNDKFHELDEKLLEYLNVPQSSLNYRRVFIFGENHLLSKAHNWFVPKHLTTKMCDLLEKTDQPFGYVIRETNFTRKLIKTTFLPENLNKNGVVLRHQAILHNSEKIPISLVEEAYYPQALQLFIAKNKNELSNKILT